ncbi:hypothetical protein [Anaerosinus gibii]|uniref:Uncharacterized protein n=1 Tax=Selenobaculum gibii TaxID=3054208 RepID=A0A9Y2EVF4_9FIRM|nr:hypothetical protein [Selenobaculum gbiensis]WIW71089.1 hypothetical protein P3F81_01820 [Selenobaculum gbiensis]
MRILKKNKVYNNVHKGQRCFILCTGPSIKEQNLKVLKNEIVFSVSDGYLCRDYADISPKYHCSVQFTYMDEFDEQVALERLKTMEQKVTSKELFFNISERCLIEKHHLFQNKNVNYVCLEKIFEQDRKKIYSIENIIPSVKSVPIMVLMIAMYMGFKEIFLIGTEHDAGLVKEKYEHAFKESSNRFYSKHISKNNVLLAKKVDIVKSRAELFHQYACLNKIASYNEVKIYNATNGGILDEFERVEFDRIFLQHVSN